MSRLPSERRAIEAGTHEPAVDDFGNQYLQRLAATPAAGIDVERVADAFHDALCDVSHHSSREVYAAAQRETQPCRVKYDRIAARLGASE
jgi:hypothetical protein